MEGAPPAGSAPTPAIQQPEVATIQPEHVVGGATYLRGPIDRPLEGVKKKLSTAELLLSRGEKQKEKKEDGEEEGDVLQLLDSGSEESGEESWEIDSSTAAEIEVIESRQTTRARFKRLVKFLDWFKQDIVCRQV